MWVAAVVVFWVYGGALSILARRDWPPLRNKLVQAGAIAGFFGLFTIAIRMLSGGVNLSLLFLFPILLVGLGCVFRFLTFLVGEWFDTARRAAVGVESMRIQKSYDRAEKAERERDWENAVRLYSEEAARDAEDPEPWRRIAEIEVRRERAIESIGPFQAALTRLKEPEARCSAAFRLADILVRLDRADEARRTIESMAQAYPGTKFESFAKERLKILASRADMKDEDV